MTFSRRGQRQATPVCPDYADEHEGSVKKFGKKVNDAVSKELQQLHDVKALVPKRKEDLTMEDRQRC